MRKSAKRIMISGIALFLVLTAVTLWIFFPPYCNLARELPEGNYTAGDLFREFARDPAGAYMRLAGKVVILEGEVAETGNGYALVGKDMCLVRCVFRKSIYDLKPDLKTGGRVTLKGVCRGMDLTEVLVTHCIILNNTE